MLRALLTAVGTFLTAEAISVKTAKVQDVPKFEVNLDLPPEDRYSHITAHYMDFWRAMALLPKGESKLTEGQINDWRRHHNIREEYVAELRGIMHDINESSLDLDHFLYSNMFYSLNYPVFCSGLLAGDANGRVTHGRNFDYEIDGMKMGNRTLGIPELLHEVTYVRGGRPLFVSIAMPGQVTVHTGMTLTEPRWSFQQNTHFANDQRLNLLAAKAGGQDFGSYVRSLMEQGLDFATAVQRMESTAFLAPSYFVVAGQGSWEGVSLEIKRGMPASAAKDNAQVLSPQINRWFLLQTNDRMWDDPLDPRRPLGTEMLGAMGQGSMGPNTVLRALRVWPIFNNYTAFTFIMVPATGYYRLVTHDEVV